MDLSKIITAPNIALMRHAQCVLGNNAPLHPYSAEYLSNSVIPVLLPCIQAATGLVGVTIFHSPKALSTAIEIQKHLQRTALGVNLELHKGLDVESTFFGEKFMATEQQYANSFAIFVTHEPQITKLNSKHLKDVDYLAVFGKDLYVRGHAPYRV